MHMAAVHAVQTTTGNAPCGGSIYPLEATLLIPTASSSGGDRFNFGAGGQHD